MIYREHAYSLVQTASPTGWRWTVQLDGSRSRTGESHRRETAISAAFAAIDTALKAAPRAKTVSHDVKAGRMIPKATT